MATTTDATQAQTDHIIRLANQLTGRADRFLSQVEDVLPMRARAIRTKADASTCIDHVKAAISDKARRAESAAPVAIPAGGITIAEAFPLLGHRIEITARGRMTDGTIAEANTREMRVESIALNETTGLPCLLGTVNGKPFSRHFHLVEAITDLGRA